MEDLSRDLGLSVTPPESCKPRHIEIHLQQDLWEERTGDEDPKAEAELS